MKRVALLLSCLALVCGLSACQRLEVANPLGTRGRGEFTRERLPFRDAIPLTYGDLIGVTRASDSPNWAQAWFVRPDKSIVVVYINARTGYMLEDVLVIPRR